MNRYKQARQKGGRIVSSAFDTVYGQIFKRLIDGWPALCQIRWITGYTCSGC